MKDRLINLRTVVQLLEQILAELRRANEIAYDDYRRRHGLP